MKTPQNHWCLNFTVAALTAASSFTSPALSRTNLNSLEQFRFDQEPKKADWQYFLKAPEADREKLWAYHLKAGHALAKWSWGWRLGWVRACGDSTVAYCGEVLHQALFDKALVVRAEAATRYGRRFEGANASLSQRAVSDLADAYRLKGNWRGGKPMFVAGRILFALHSIGGAQALAAGTRLAAMHPETKAYWRKLSASD